MCKNIVTYVFLGPSWVLITMDSRNGSIKLCKKNKETNSEPPPANVCKTTSETQDKTRERVENATPGNLVETQQQQPLSMRTVKTV